jgi:C4-dicarboxylate transporter
MKILSLTLLAGIIFLINSRSLLKNIKSKQSILYILLLGSGWALSLLYTSDINVQSPFQALEAFFDPVHIWLWG